MAALKQTNNARRHVLGDLVVRHYTLAAIANGDTLKTSQNDILHVSITPTTAVAIGCTVLGDTITFAVGSTIAADVAVLSRIG